MKPLFIVSLVVILAFHADALAQRKKVVGRSGAAKHAVSQNVAPKPGYSGKCGGGTLTAGEAAELVAAHNTARATRRLAPFSWDCRLADMAQEWANKGVFEHRTGILEGENLFVSSDPSEPVATVLTTWLAEKVNWNNKTVSCAPGKFCNHYTQVMWQTTTKVGCGINRAVSGKWKVLVVCNYSPGQSANMAPYPDE